MNPIRSARPQREAIPFKASPAAACPDPAGKPTNPHPRTPKITIPHPRRCKAACLQRPAANKLASRHGPSQLPEAQSPRSPR